MHALPLIALLCATLSAPAAAQVAVFAIESPTGVGHDLVGVDEGTLGRVSLAFDVELLDIKLAGYAPRDRLRTDLARIVGQSGPAPHVRLPELGSLYRVGQVGTTGLMMVQAGGDVAFLGDLPDAGTDRALDQWITVDPSGTLALVATPLSAGGDVYLLDLAQQTHWTNLTSALPPLQVDGLSLRLSSLFGWFVAEGRLFRFGAGPLAHAEETALPLSAGETLLPDLAMCREGFVVAAVSENPQGERMILTAGPFGPASYLTTSAADYDLPSFDSPVGPLLAISDDGSRVAYRRSVVAQAKELFVQRVAVPAVSEQLTSDALFTDTIDSVGVLGFVDGGRLTFVAGEGQPVGSEVMIEGADVFMVDTAGPTSTPPVNLTLTSGIADAPFTDYGELKIFSATVDPLNQRLLIDVDPDNGDHALVSVRIDGGLKGVTDLLSAQLLAPVLAPAGDSVLILTVPEQPAPFDQGAYLLSPVIPGSPAQLKLMASASGPVPLAFERFALDRSGLKAGFVASLGNGIELPALVDIPGARLHAALSTILSVSQAIAFTPTGRMAVGLGFPGGPNIQVGFDAPGSAQLYPIHPGDGFPLDN
jgi:hypothetical protein